MCIRDRATELVAQATELVACATELVACVTELVACATELLTLWTCSHECSESQTVYFR